MRFPSDAHSGATPGLRLKMHDALVGDDLDGLGSPQSWNGKKGTKKEVFAADVPTYLARLDPLSQQVTVAMEHDKHMEKVGRCLLLNDSPNNKPNRTMHFVFVRGTSRSSYMYPLTCTLLHIPSYIYPSHMTNQLTHHLYHEKVRKRQAKIRAKDALAKLAADNETDKKHLGLSNSTKLAAISTKEPSSGMSGMSGKEGGELIVQLRRRKGESAESLVTNAFLNRLFNTKATEKDAHDLILRMEDILDLLDAEHTGYVDWDTFTR